MSATPTTRTNSDDYKTTVKVFRSQADRIQEISGHQPAHEFLEELLDLYEATENLNKIRGR